MIKRRIKRLLVASSFAARVYQGFRTIAWWRQRRRSALAWTGEYLPILSRIERDVPPRPFPEIERQISEELGRPPGDVFLRLDPKPIACASLAQVHWGALHDGRAVAVKVPHPGVDGAVRADTRFLGGLLRLLARLDRGIDLRPIVDEIVGLAPQELDYVHEARNAERLAAGFAGRDDVIVPAVHWRYTTPRLLVVDYVEGIDAGRVDELRAAGIDPAAVARLVADVYCRQLTMHGFFHADPHPGNLLVQPGPRLAILDFGLCRPLDDRFRLAFARLIQAMSDRDPVALFPAFEELGVRTRGGGDQSVVLVLAHVFTDLLRLGGYPGRRLRDEADARVAGAVREDAISEIPPELLLILRQIGLLGWLTDHLGYRVDLLQAFRPYSEAILAEAA